MSFVRLMILFGCMLLIGYVQVGYAQETPEGTTTTESTDPGQCARDFLEWCGKQVYSGSGISVHVVTVQDGESYFTLACTKTNTNGTECKKDNEVWFQCHPDKTVTFQKESLTEDTKNPDVCKARDEYFGMIKESEETRKQFKKQMGAFRHSMDNMSRQLSRMFGRGFPFGNGNDYDDYDLNRKNFYNIDGKRSTTPGAREPEFDTEP